MHLVDELISAGLLCDEYKAMLYSKQDYDSIVDFIIEFGLVKEADLYNFFSHKYNMKLINIGKSFIESEDYYKWNVINDKFIVLQSIGETISVIISDPGNLLLIDKIKRRYKDKKINFLLAPNSQIKNFKKLFNSSEVTVIEKINKILRSAIVNNVSDIHFNPEEKFVNIKFRISGKLTDYGSIFLQDWHNMNRRIKVLGDLDITETRIPQSGYGSLVMPNKLVHLRISTHPGIFGEAITIRIQDFDSQFLVINSLGFDDITKNKILSAISIPNGLFIIAGPTGSGKTTTLYGILNELKDKNKNIMTLEDPVELRIPGIKQLDIKEENLITFADGIKSILRHDPDIILIGEIRDSETAKMAVRAALTGKLVFTTIHAANCVSAVDRLMDLGVDFKEIINNTAFIMSQRLFSEKYLGKQIPIAEFILFDDSLRNNLDSFEVFKNIFKEEDKLINISRQKVVDNLITQESFEQVFGKIL